MFNFKKKKVGYFFGSFNPPTLAHMEMAYCAIKDGPLDKVVFVPAKKNPQKSAEDLVKFEDRVEMLSRSIRDLDFGHLMEISKMEKEAYITFHTVYSYMTLEFIRDQRLKEKRYLIMGADTFDNLHTWKHREKFNGERVLIFPRYKNNTPEIEEVKLGKTGIRKRGYNYKTDYHNWSISSTLIRDYLKKGLNPSLFVTKGSFNFIIGKGFYTNS